MTDPLTFTPERRARLKWFARVMPSKDIADALAHIDALQEENGKLRGAISWLEPPFVDQDTPDAEVLQRVDFMLADVARIGKTPASSPSPPATGEGGREPTEPAGRPQQFASDGRAGDTTPPGSAGAAVSAPIPPSTGGGDVEALVEEARRYCDSTYTMATNVVEWRDLCTRLATALAARRPGPSVEEVTTQKPTYDQVARIMDGEAAGSWFATEYEHFKQRVIPAVLALFYPTSETHAEEKP